MVEVAVEQVGRALGRCRLQVIDDITGPTLQAFTLDHLEIEEISETDGGSRSPRPGKDAFLARSATGLTEGRASRPRPCRPRQDC